MKLEHKVAITLALTGMLASIFLGVYLTATLTEIEPFLVKTGNLTQHMIMVISATAAISLLTGIGIYFLKKAKRGAEFAILISGIVSLAICIYYDKFFHPSLLKWITPLIYIIPTLFLFSWLVCLLFTKKGSPVSYC